VTRLTLVAVAVGLIAVVWYLIACWLWPFAACWRCKGDGKRRSPSGRAWRPCRRCRGTGARRRIGRMIYAYFRRAHDKAV
jgi:hypothetical protein